MKEEKDRVAYLIRKNDKKHGQELMLAADSEEATFVIKEIQKRIEKRMGLWSKGVSRNFFRRTA